MNKLQIILHHKLNFCMYVSIQCVCMFSKLCLSVSWHKTPVSVCLLIQINLRNLKCQSCWWCSKLKEFSNEIKLIRFFFSVVAFIATHDVRWKLSWKNVYAKVWSFSLEKWTTRYFVFMNFIQFSITYIYEI